ncbi:MAG: hypothetical protein BWY22_02446 [Bacteroidetes bacterium ADurb.Bin217]|nr:MAG: hypothetical protein BWY22_02446 [Bacteroidetes bacterium ADurb.Bin217]
MLKIIKSKKDIISLIVISIILSVGLCGAALYISNEYFKTHAYFYDPVGDYSRTIPFYERMQQEADLNPIASRINFAKIWFQADPKSPFLYIPTILLYPKLLTTPWAMMPAMFFALSSLLCMLGYSLRLRNQSFLSVISILLLFCAGHLMLNPERGIAAGWLDLPASFLLTSGIIAFLNWRDFRNRYWLLLSAVFIALASMSRSTIIIYAAILLCVPIILSYIEQRTSLKTLGLYILLIAIFITPFYYYSFDFNYRYYTSLNSGIADSVSSSITLFMHTFSIIGIAYMIGFVLLLLFLFYKHRQIVILQSKYSVGIFLWILVILPIFWVFVQKTGNTYHVYLTLYSLFFILFLGITNWLKTTINKSISYSIIVFYSITMINSFITHLHTAQNPTLEATDTKQLYTNIAKHVAQLQPNETWLAYFAEDVTRIANVEAYNQYGVYPKKYAQGILYFHHSYWRAEYGDMSDAEIADSIVKLLPHNVFVIIPYSHQSIDSIVPQQFTTTRAVLHKSLDYIVHNNWERCDGFKTLKYGSLDAFYNKYYILFE